MIGSSCADDGFGSAYVRLDLGKEAAALMGAIGRDRPALEWLAERQKVASELGIDHRTFVNHDKAGAGGGPSWLSVISARRRPLGGAVDQRVDGRGTDAALGAHHQCRFAGEGCKNRLACAPCAIWRASVVCRRPHSRTDGTLRLARAHHLPTRSRPIAARSTSPSFGVLHSSPVASNPPRDR